MFLGLIPAALALACGNADAGRESAPVLATTASAAVAPAGDTGAVTGFNPRLLRRFAPLRTRLDSAASPVSPDQIALGRALYFDKRLSKKRDLSCNSCHRLDAYGVDGEATSLGDGGQRGGRNSPTVYNSAGYFAQFWDGRAADVEEQAKGPILNPVEMAMPSAAAVVARLKAIPGYAPLFAKAFPHDPDPVTYDNVGRAIGAFERGLTTPSRWDRYLAGDKSALSGPEIEGLKVFTNVGCMVCHTGEFLGGNSYQRAGAVEPWPNQADPGRAAVTKNDADRMMFKVPTLRNVTKTAPYFHDGSARGLDEAVRMMGKHQLGLDLADTEVRSIVTWLGALTGELPREYIAEPSLPELSDHVQAGNPGVNGVSPETEASAPAVPSDSAVAPATNASGAAVTCGKPGLPDCPLQAWMKANLQVYLKQADGKRLAAALDTLARHEPRGYVGWAAAANGAAKAARAGNFAQVRTECKNCHDQLRSAFRTEMRSVRLF
jgi:cytochrome c peroxidase